MGWRRTWKNGSVRPTSHASTARRAIRINIASTRPRRRIASRRAAGSLSASMEMKMMLSMPRTSSSATSVANASQACGSATSSMGDSRKCELLSYLDGGHQNEGAAPHAHPEMEQVCYVLEGTAVAEVAGERCELKAGDSCYFPAGAMHKFTATSDRPVKVLVIYSPPYGESPERVVRPK